MSPIIKLENVSTVYEGEKRPAIKDVTLNVERGEFIYIIGPNAAGKTTLLETINGLLPVFKGNVEVMGFNMRKNGCKVRREIGYVPQDFIMEPNEPYKALDVVLMGRYGKIGAMRRISREDVKEAIAAMRLLGIEELAERPIGKLSGGQQQKVMIARAVAKKPKILLLDEPFSSLDPKSREKVSNLMAEINVEHNITVLMVTHDLHHISGVCNRIIVMNNGKMIADCEPQKALRIIEEMSLPISWRSRI